MDSLQKPEFYIHFRRTVSGVAVGEYVPLADVANEPVIAEHSAISGLHLLTPSLHEISLERPPGEIRKHPCDIFWMIPISGSALIWHLLSRLSLIACPFLWSKTQVGNPTVSGIHFQWIFLFLTKIGFTWRC